MKTSISVAICCYNSASRLPQTLAALAKQTGTSGISWEVMVIDNASTDNTAAIALESWPATAPAPLRVLREPKPGVAHARRCALDQARYEIMSFIDDDNWVCETWIQTVAELMENHPDAGACGGRSEAYFETPPPPWMGDLVRTLAVGEQTSRSGDVTETHGWLWGAGMSVRRAAWTTLVANGYSNLLTSRTGKGLGAGEDAELSLALRMLGWRIYYTGTLSFVHHIPPFRLRWDYFQRLYRGFGCSEVILDIYECYLADGLGQKKQSENRSRRLPKWLSASWRIPVLWLKLRLKSKQAREGDENVLRMEGLIGYLETLWKERKRQAALHQEISALAARLEKAALQEGRILR